MTVEKSYLTRNRSLLSRFVPESIISRQGVYTYTNMVDLSASMPIVSKNGINAWRRKSIKFSKLHTTVFTTSVDPRDESHKDTEYIDFSVPRLARYLHSAWKRHQDAVFWVDIDLAIKRRINILSNTIECNFFSRNTSSPLYFKSWKIENWRDVVWKTIFVSSTTTKDLIETRSQLD